jgi:hypothetical protein
MFDQERRTEEDGVRGQDDQLDGQQQDAGPADEQGPLGRVEDLREGGRHAGAAAKLRVEPPSERPDPGGQIGDRVH